MYIKTFDNISIPIPKKEIYARLGYAAGKTKISPAEEKKIGKYIDKAAGFLILKGTAARLAIKEKNGKKIVFDGNIAFNSASLVELLKDSSEVLFMGATAGQGIVDEIQAASAGKDVTGAVIYDAVASETVDACLDLIGSYYSRELRRENRKLTSRRFSCGYGDFFLENQRIMWDTLELEKLGVAITENSILVPEKTVTAVAGIEVIR